MSLSQALTEDICAKPTLIARAPTTRKEAMTGSCKVITLSLGAGTLTYSCRILTLSLLVFLASVSLLENDEVRINKLQDYFQLQLALI